METTGTGSTKTLETGFLRLPEVLQYIPVGKSTWWAGIQSGHFPKGIKLTQHTTAWRVEDILRLIEDLSAQEQEQGNGEVRSLALRPGDAEVSHESASSSKQNPCAVSNAIRSNCTDGDTK